MLPPQNWSLRPRRVASPKNKLRVGPSLATRCDHGSPQLNLGLRRQADFEPDLQRLALEGRRDWKYHIGQFRGRVHEEVGVGVELERRERLPSAACDRSRFAPKPISARIP